MSASPPFSSSPRSFHAEPARASRSAATPWATLAVVAAVLAISGGVRLRQGWRVEQALERDRPSPFPLAELPSEIGPWRGETTAMDPRIVRIAGAVDLIARHYVDRRTGVGLDVVVLYGPTAEVSPHTPAVCYPSAGYEPLPGEFERPIAVGGGSSTAPFVSMAFTKGEGGLVDAREVYYSLRYEGHWTPRPAGSKASRRIPGIYKVQVSRRLAGRERRDVDNPCEPFLAGLIGEIEARIVGGHAERSAMLD